MKILPALAVSAAIVLTAGAAYAADLYSPTPSYTPAPTYSAPVATRYYDWTGPYAGAIVGYGWGGLSDAIVATETGLTAGAFVGYGIQNGSLVYGAEMDAEWSNRDSGAGDQVNWTSSFRGRIGFAVNRFLVYGTAGVAVAGVTTSAPSSSTEVGWTVGGGVEAALTDSLFGRVQYTFTNYGLAAGTGATLHTQELSAGVGFRF